MTRSFPHSRLLGLLAALALVVVAVPLGASSASATSAVTRAAYDVPAFCSQAGGLQQNLARPVSVLRLTVSPASPRAGAKVRVRVFVQQPQTTPPGQVYPRGFVRGEVVVAFAGKNHTIAGPSNRRAVSGELFPAGWTAKGAFTAPSVKGKYKVKIKRIAYNVFGGGRTGGWSKPYTGFDLVCTAGLDPTVRATPFTQPRLTIKVRRAL